MVKLAKVKLSGSTLIEVLIAMVIIVAVFSIAMVIFNNVLKTGVSFRKLQVQNQMNILKNEVIKSGKLYDSIALIDSVNYKLTVDTSNLEGISKLKIEASVNGQILGVNKCLFKNTDAKN